MLHTHSIVPVYLPYQHNALRWIDTDTVFLRDLGHEVYDFKNPPHGNGGFQWSDIDPDWQNWTTEQYREALNHPIAQKGFDSDFNGMKWADVCVMVLPCGRSANTEAGWMMPLLHLIRAN